MRWLKALAAAAALAAAPSLTAGSLAQAYDPMARPAAPANPLYPGAGQKGAAGPGDAAVNPDLGNLPDTPGAEETYYLCSACHSLAIVRQQHLPDSRWDYLWGWMVEEQGMPEQDAETKALILGYLKRHFSSDR